jgi:hypothetical protein
MNAYMLDGSELLRYTADEPIWPKDPSPLPSNPLWFKKDGF